MFSRPGSSYDKATKESQRSVPGGPGSAGGCAILPGSRAGEEGAACNRPVRDRSKQYVCWTMFCVLTCLSLSAEAQYPKVSKADGRRARAKTEAMNRHSDEAWARALPAIEAWTLKGKPYLPGAQKPSDLPQADIPAFPGGPRWGHV